EQKPDKEIAVKIADFEQSTYVPFPFPKGLRTPLQSFKPHHIEWLKRDLALIGGLGAAGTSEFLYFRLSGDE
ncbi:MAG: hypothetical protein ACI9G1_003882, partial [Pirellulaceae bacterium]